MSQRPAAADFQYFTDHSTAAFAARPEVNVGLQGDLQRAVPPRPLNLFRIRVLAISVVARKCRSA
jgi:hypothetical protein